MLNWIKKILKTDDPYDTWWYAILSGFFNVTGKIKWSFIYKLRTGKWHKLTDMQLATISVLLNSNYAIMVTRRDFHLSTYLIMLGNYIKTREFGFWCHTVQNVEEDETTTDDDFILYESVGAGVKISTFDKVFNCDHVAILVPKNLSLDEWNDEMYKIRNRMSEELGREYDNAFLIFDERRMSCIEYTIAQLRKLPSWEKIFPNLNRILKEKNNCTPDMLFNCGDFQVLYMAKNGKSLL